MMGFVYQCRKCGVVLSEENASKGQYRICRECWREYGRTYWREHPRYREKKRQYHLQYSRDHVMIVNRKYVHANKPPNPEDNVCQICGKKEKTAHNGKLYALACHHWNDPKVSFRCCQECNIVSLKAIDIHGIEGLIKINEKYQVLKAKLEQAE